MGRHCRQCGSTLGWCAAQRMWELSISDWGFQNREIGILEFECGPMLGLSLALCWLSGLGSSRLLGFVTFSFDLRFGQIICSFRSARWGGIHGDLRFGTWRSLLLHIFQGSSLSSLFSMFLWNILNTIYIRILLGLVAKWHNKSQIPRMMIIIWSK